MEWLKDIRALIFDLDGTLYQDYTFMGRYIEKMLCEACSKEEVEQSVAFAYELLEGRNVLKLGNLYHPVTQNFYRQEKLQPFASFDWDGNETEFVKMEETPLTYIGDPWTIAALLGEKYNIPQEQKVKAFNEVRQEMLQEPNQIPKRWDLFEEIKRLEDYYLILMTNTPLPSAQEFVDYLEINYLFDEFHFDGRKPKGMKSVVASLLAKGYKPNEILSVGDHPWNDLYPVYQAGGHTCLISQYEHDDTTDWSVKIKSIDELVSLIQKFNQVKQLI